MKRIILSALFMVSVIPLLLSQDSIKFNHLSIGLNGGIGYNFNAYRLTADDQGFTYYGINPHSSYGMELGFLIKNKIRLRTSLGYHKMEYGMYWNNLTEFDKTITHLTYMDLGFHIDYSIFATKRLQLFISPGLTGEILTHDEFENFLTDGHVNTKNYNVLSEEYPSEVLGANLSVPLRYKIINHFYLAISPGYTYYFKKFSSANDKAYQRINLNFGIEYSFW